MEIEWRKLSDEKTLPKQTLRFPMFYFSGIRIPIPNNMAFFVKYSVFAKKKYYWKVFTPSYLVM